MLLGKEGSTDLTPKFFTLSGSFQNALRKLAWARRCEKT